jgi:23S rRNA (cytosine1962-C5)-methyltransferase
MTRIRRAGTDRRRPAAVADVDSLVSRALAQRAARLSDPQTNALRLFHGAADGLDGLVVEKFADVLVAQLHEGRLMEVGGAEPEPARRVAAALAERVGARAVYRKVFPRDRSTAADTRPEHRDRRPWIGEPADAEFAVCEGGLRLLVRPYDGLSTGLFLDQRENRARVRAAARGRRVLNTFAYTCGFGVAAGAGGAAEVVNVDVSKRYLEWGRRNLEANGLAPESHWFICSDVFDYFRRARRQGRVFDVVILDPPTFGRDKRSGAAFAIESDLERLVAEAVELMSAGGLLLVSTNHRGTPAGRLKRAVERTGRARVVDAPRLPDDFAGDEGFAKSVWCAVDRGGAR